MLSFKTFDKAIEYLVTDLKNFGEPIVTESWQGMKIDERYTMFSQRNVDFCVYGIPADREVLEMQIKPDLPWAHDHFMERVSGKPLNPGEQYKNWKFFKNSPGADEKFRKDGGKFSHTYMERYWPKRINTSTRLDLPHIGLRFPYGDLDDLVRLLQDEPHTRQAYLPVWFPEDTGAVQRQRVPCTLGYLFQLRANKFGQYYFHVNYYIRSCDAFKHFRNDIYLTCRLLLWILEELRTRQSHQSKINWHHVIPGAFSMYIADFHVFKAEKNLLCE
jgi:hypothetical protein